MARNGGGKITGEAQSAWSHSEHSGNSSGLWKHVEVRVLAKSESTEVFSVIREPAFESLSDIQ